MADFITDDVSLDRHGRNDGWFVQPADGRPFLFLSTEEVDALVAWRTGTGIWSSSEPPSTADMAPGTTFIGRFRAPDDSHEDRFTVMDDLWVRASNGQWSVAIGIDPSTIRDVTPPAEETRG